MLGVGGIFLSTSSRGYTDEQEAKYAMVSNFNGKNAVQSMALARAEEILGDPNNGAIFAQRHKAMLEDVIDVTAFVVREVRGWAEQGFAYKPNTASPSPRVAN
jgi:hypothetical protein